MALGSSGRIRHGREVSREEAHRRTPARRRRTGQGPPGAGRPPDEGPARSRPPLCTVRTDRAAGSVCVRGHLDGVGAEFLCRIVTALRESGHRQVVVLLGSATVAEDARALLAGLARGLPAGHHLELR